MVDPVDFLEEKELLGFLHVNKTELSCMEAPQTFVSQLRDYGLVSREQHRKLIRMKSKEKIRSALYDILDYVETKGSNYIHRFWKCAFKETILNKYPALKLLRNSLFDGSYQSECSQLEEDDDNTDPNVEDVPEKKGKEDKKGKRKRKSARDGDDDDNNEASTSSKITTPARKTRKKPCFSTPLKQGGNDDIWTWPFYKTVLPVTCGDLEASLNRDKLARAEKCIKMDDRWYTPTEFEKLAGKGASKNWKLSIYCRNTTIGKLIQDGHLKSIRFKKTSKVYFQ